MRERETAIISEIKEDVKWQKWKEQISAQVSSGLTVREWCRQNNVNEKSYYYHLRRVREKLCEAESQTVVAVSTLDYRKCEEIRIEKNGLKIAVPADICREALIELVRELC